MFVGHPVSASPRGKSAPWQRRRDWKHISLLLRFRQINPSLLFFLSAMTFSSLTQFFSAALIPLIISPACFHAVMCCRPDQRLTPRGFKTRNEVSGATKRPEGLLARDGWTPTERFPGSVRSKAHQAAPDAPHVPMTHHRHGGAMTTTVTPPVRTVRPPRKARSNASGPSTGASRSMTSTRPRGRTAPRWRYATDHEHLRPRRYETIAPRRPQRPSPRWWGLYTQRKQESTAATARLMPPSSRLTATFRSGCSTVGA